MQTIENVNTLPLVNTGTWIERLSSKAVSIVAISITIMTLGLAFRVGLLETEFAQDILNFITWYLISSVALLIVLAAILYWSLASSRNGIFDELNKDSILTEQELYAELNSDFWYVL